jgi:hypothetical protein
MNVKEAVAAAKAFVIDTFADEDPTNIGLEEVDFDELSHVWRVTIGFTRPWQNRAGWVTSIGAPILRSYKIVTVDDADGRVVSIKNRAVNDAA